MKKILTRERNDLYSYPTIQQKEWVRDISLGDLHSNPIKFIYFLIHRGICSLSKEHYKTLIDIYKNFNLENSDEKIKKDLECFNHILTNELRIINSHNLIRLIGDELADRGVNDYFILKILEKLHHHNVTYEILVSNHGAEFIGAYEKFEEKRKQLLRTILKEDQAQSLSQLNQMIQKNIVHANEVFSIIENCYKPKLKLLSYTLDETTGGITLYSHAEIINLKPISLLASKFNVPYNDSTSQHLAQTIEKINAQFSKYVSRNEVSTLIKKTEIQKLCSLSQQKCHSEIGSPTIDNIFEYILWNRSYKTFEPETKHRRSGYSIHFVHGHDSPKVENKNIFNLNSDIGKSLLLNHGLYIDLISNEVQLSSAKKEKVELNDLIFSAPGRLSNSPDVVQGTNLTKSAEPPLPPLKLSKTPPSPFRERTPKRSPQRTISPQSFHYELSIHQKRLHHELTLLALKRDELLRRKEMNAYDAAKTLYEGLTEASNTFFVKNKQKKEEYQFFKTNCYCLIETARPELEKHRDCRTILANILLSIAGIGVIYLIAAAINKAVTGKFLFFSSTNSSKRLDAIQKVIFESDPIRAP